MPVLSFKNDNIDPTRYSLDMCYMFLEEIKYQPIKNKQKVYEKFIEISRNEDYTTGNLLDFSSHQNY